MADFKFATFTASGKIRKPAVFKGFRDDKNPKDVVFELPLTEAQEEKVIEKQETPLIKTSAEGETKKAKREPEYEESNWRYILSEEITSSGEVTLDGKKVKLTNVEREIWKGMPKAWLIQYYNRIPPFILPH